MENSVAPRYPALLVASDAQPRIIRPLVGGAFVRRGEDRRIVDTVADVACGGILVPCKELGGMPFFHIVVLVAMAFHTGLDSRHLVIFPGHGLVRMNIGVALQAGYFCHHGVVALFVLILDASVAHGAGEQPWLFLFL